MSTVEKFFNRDAQFSVTTPTDGSPATLSGYAMVWNVTSGDRGGFVVRLMPNSARFAEPTNVYWDHNSRDILATTNNNTLRIVPDNYGVKVEIDLPNTSAGRDVAELVRRGDIRGMSFSQRVGAAVRKSVTTKEKGVTIRNDKEFIVDEVTVTAEPAFTQSTLAVKTPGPNTFSAVDVDPAHVHKLQRFQLDEYQLARAELPRDAG